MVDHQDESCDDEFTNTTVVSPSGYSYCQLLQQENNNKFDSDGVEQEMDLESATSLEETGFLGETEVLVSGSNDKTGFMERIAKQLKATFAVTLTILKYVNACTVVLLYYRQIIE